jgi:RNA polymerase sigma factor (sigma-70 family)
MQVVMLAPSSASDETLQVEDADRAAWNELVARHNRRVLLFLLARGARVDVAQDIAQQAWLRIYEQHRQRRLQTLELPGIVVRQADFLLRDHRRRTRRVEGSGEADDHAELPEGAEPQIIARDQIRRVEAAVSACTPSQQRVFWAVQEQPDVPHERIAGTLGISVQHLRQTLHEVRKRIRLTLEIDHE